MRDTDDFQKELIATVSFTVKHVEEAVWQSFSSCNWSTYKVRENFFKNSEDIPLFNGCRDGFSAAFYPVCARKMRDIYYENTDLNPEVCTEAFKEALRQEKWGGFLREINFLYERVLSEKDPKYAKILSQKDEAQKIKQTVDKDNEKQRRNLYQNITDLEKELNKNNYDVSYEYFIYSFEEKIGSVCRRAQEVLQIIAGRPSPDEIPVEEYIGGQPDIRAHIVSRRMSNDDLDAGQTNKPGVS